MLHASRPGPANAVRCTTILSGFKTSIAFDVVQYTLSSIAGLDGPLVTLNAWTLRETSLFWRSSTSVPVVCGVAQQTSSELTPPARTHQIALRTTLTCGSQSRGCRMGLTTSPVGHGSAPAQIATHQAAICDRAPGLVWLDTLPVQPASNVGNVQPLPHVIRVWPRCIHLQQNRLGILVNGERESHVPDRLSKSLTLCAETTAHVIQQHDDGKTLPTGVLRTARATHASGENASP